jgi:hypothetical protein
MIPPTQSEAGIVMRLVDRKTHVGDLILIVILNPSEV